MNLATINLEMKVEKELASKYCQAIEKNLFEGLDKEFALKYEYFFSSIPKKTIPNMNLFMENFVYEVQSICDYKFSDSNKNEFLKYFEKFYFGNRDLKLD